MLADTIAAEIAAHRRTLYAPSTYRGVLSYTCHRCGAPHSRTAEDIDRERACRACRVNDDREAAR